MIKRKHYIDKTGKFLGSFEGCKPDEESIEVLTIPTDKKQKYINGDWTDIPDSEKHKDVIDRKNVSLDDIVTALIKIYSGDDKLKEEGIIKIRSY